ncbi:flavin-containing monooxygenase [Rhodotorula paludigena]|uniref:flavin-containing monooxygenase n=1 Tax=Rhodotorula paludigena TaxID=86838 RepID=UPI00317F7298
MDYDSIVIGGGPAGLTALKTLRENGFKCILFEAEQAVGGTFRYRSYEHAELVSSKQLTAFSDFRFPPEQGDHVTLPEFVRYLERYCDHFGLWRVIRLGSRVMGVNRRAGGEGHVVEVKREGEDRIQRFTCRYLTICTGLHVIPQTPVLSGIQHVAENPHKRVCHSSEYKQLSELKGRRVLILGTGETGMDLAYSSIKAGAEEVVLCSRGGFLSFPKVLNNFRVLGSTFDGHLPIDGLITNLFESAYVHPWVAASHLRWFVSDFVIKRVLWGLTGTSAGCAQWVGELPPERLGRAYVFLNKSHKAMTYINRPYKKRSKLLSLVSDYYDPPEDAATPGIVELAPWPIGFEADGTVKWDWDACEKKGGSWKRVRARMEGRKVEPNLVIFASGYKQEFSSWLSPEYPRPWDTDMRDVLSSSAPDVAFIGFVRPGVGAIPPIAEQQSMWWTALLQKKMKLSTDPPHYYLLSRPEARIQYGVDHSTYMSTLARDMGASPGLWELLRTHGPFITLVYCFSAAFTSHYRLVGPFKSDKAPEVVRTEIWDTVTRRGLLGNIFMGVIPMAFYAIVNLAALWLETTWIAFGRPDVLGWYERTTGRDLRGLRKTVAPEPREKKRRAVEVGERLPN